VDASNEPIDVPETAADAKRLLGKAIALTRAGRMNPKIGTALSYMTMAFLKTLEITNVETRVRALEELSLNASRQYAERQDSVLQQREPTPEEFDRAIEAEFSRSPTATCGDPNGDS
jgi:hypothetical protein